MCGIAGVVARQRLDRLSTLLDGFSSGLQHRGPDDHGFLSSDGNRLSLGRDAAAVSPGNVALIHRRLSIIDLSERGWQPMVDASGQYAIVLNGEIYNYPELRQDLETEGIAFRSHTDTEVLLNLLIRFGIDGLSRVVGMFAFAFLDVRGRRLWLARDPFGIKPLFYAVRDEELAFASEIRPLLELGFARRLVEPTALFQYLRHAVTDHGELTMISGVRQLPPAHTLEVDVETLSIGRPRRYWAPSLVTRAAGTLEDATEELRALFTDSVRLHLRADVPVAATLSGGIDSSAIVGTIVRVNGGVAPAIFSYIADDPRVGEERFVDAVAVAIGARPQKIAIGPERLVAELDSLILSQEQPFTTTSMWAQSQVFRRVHDEGFKVVMDGQGADELFAGYPVFRAARLASLLRAGHWQRAVRLLRGIPESRLIPLLQAIGSLLPEGLQTAARQLVLRPAMPRWLNGHWFERHSVEIPRPFAASDAPSELTAQLYDATVATSLPMLLRYADRNAMAVSLENRVPFLTTRLADFALSLPDDLLIGPDGTTKRLFRRAMRGVVPDAILDRRDKIGFVTPEALWFGESTAMRGRLGAVIARPLPVCFAPGLSARLHDVVEGRAPYGPEVWRCWNALRWAELLRLEFPS
jgi:asparagine synthase (glutamine-hydrolysing)